MKMKIDFVCRECGKKAEPDKAKSLANWDVIPAKCTGFGGRLKPYIQEK
jgi:hypothetical protein